jgi:hypothetical protein
MREEMHAAATYSRVNVGGGLNVGRISGEQRDDGDELEKSTSKRNKKKKRNERESMRMRFEQSERGGKLTIDSTPCTGIHLSPASSYPYWSTPGACCQSQKKKKGQCVPVVQNGTRRRTRIEIQTSPFLYTARNTESQRSAPCPDPGQRASKRPTIRVPHLGEELHLGWIEREIQRERQRRAEKATFVERVGRSAHRIVGKGVRVSYRYMGT